MSPELIFPGIGGLLVALGWPMATRRIPPNRWYGLRVPATMADERVWYEANAVTGRDMMYLGAATGVIALALPRVTALPTEAYAGVCAGILGVGSLLLTWRGWRVANQLRRERRGGQRGGSFPSA